MSYFEAAAGAQCIVADCSGADGDEAGGEPEGGEVEGGAAAGAVPTFADWVESPPQACKASVQSTTLSIRRQQRVVGNGSMAGSIVEVALLCC